jgi:NADH-quinone oxidoreductase subunit M
MFGKLQNPANESLKDLSLREFAVFLPLLLLAFGIGIFPKPFLNVLDKPVEKVIRIVNPEFYEREAAVPTVPADAEKPVVGKGGVR